MRFCSLGSGSRGNALLVRSPTACLLVDCGFGPRELERRLARAGAELADIDAILVTHEHSDHAGGVSAVARRARIPVYATAGTAGAAHLGRCELRLLERDRPIGIAGFEVMPVSVPHDAREPCQYVLTCAGRRLGVLTDLGHVPASVMQHYAACDALVLECNHDAEMLATGPYPWPLKRRVGGEHGHLSNAQAAGLVAGAEKSRLQHLVAAHLSEQNNAPSRARAALREALGHERGLGVADQATGFDWLEIL